MLKNVGYAYIKMKEEKYKFTYIQKYINSNCPRMFFINIFDFKDTK